MYRIFIKSNVLLHHNMHIIFKKSNVLLHQNMYRIYFKLHKYIACFSEEYGRILIISAYRFVILRIIFYCNKCF